MWKSKENEYRATVQGRMCKGVRGDLWQPQIIGITKHAEFVRECYLVAGMTEAAAALVNPEGGESPWEAKARFPPGWVMHDYEEGFELQDSDWLVWAWSKNGTEPPSHETLQAGNTTCGFLIEASGDYPTVWQSHDINIPGDIYPLEECLKLREEFEMITGKIAWIFRYKGLEE